MRSEKLTRARRNLSAYLFLGALALGFGLVLWASINIGAEPRPPVDVRQTPASNVATIALRPDALVDTDFAATDEHAASGVPDARKAAYAKNPKVGDTIGTLSIPDLKRTLPIIEGTGDEELKRGVGHFSKSVLPGEKDNCVLSGHRDTVFRGLDKLKKGDRLVTKTSAGTFTYEIARIRIVDKDDKTVIVPTDHAVLTVTTCYPFNYVGSAPDRYILVADLVTKR